ncbi:phosphoenolpyruvate synthase [Kocuria rosea]|uniref:phosphoenolpyruvate synthase n=1 Tax=Kocuria rosea TaxID=1275 RepID=UPI000D647BC0|nr:phosphoenolpyruvate synthase [Kocuria rosea]PWF87020.1 phosphoenolpyruvate synthase [Kocuria rosea]STX15796.1 Phosphoenolpyruvate synthase [Kocuria rosea]
MAGPEVHWFEELGIADVPRVGGKNASLGEMVRELASRGVRVPGGFATTADAYRSYVEANGIGPALRDRLEDHRAGRATLRETGAAVRELFLRGEFPAGTARQIRQFYRELSARTGRAGLSVAVRSSATAEDLPDASFAGQQETFLNVVGEDELLEACRRCYASLFTDRAITYRELKGFDHLAVALSVGVQEMVRADLGCSGVMFSIDTESGFPRVAVVSATWGLGETVVQGTVDPDKYLVFKPLLDVAEVPIVERTRGAKLHKLVHDDDAPAGAAATRLVQTSPAERQAWVLGDHDVLRLGRWAVLVEDHYGRPMDLEWAKDGLTGELFLLQARPETVQAGRSGTRFTIHHLRGEGRVLAVGAAVGDAVATGPACVVRTAADIESFRDGSVLVTEMTDPDWVPVMKRAAAIVTDHGGTTSHAAIVSRELGLPAVVGTGDASRTIPEGQELTVSCAAGDRGTVYEGTLPFDVEEVDLGELPESRTAIMVNVASPAAAFRWWRLPADGVGLARMEFVVNNIVEVHPMALVHPERVRDEADRRRIAELTAGFPDGQEYFVQTLALGLAKLAAPYHPRPVIVRLSDFKSNEYAHLVGGAAFEEPEENPMLGFRGASRYYDPRYREGFALECRALRRVRERIGFDNVVVMVPFCRTVGEADRVLATMAEHGLERGRHGLKVYMMCEIPSNVVLAEQFATRFDGFSIGSNDLTQLVLGVDRDAEALRALFDERDEAVTRMISEAIRKAHAAGIPIGICGQGPSNHPDFAEFLVREGIDSISLNPDSFLRTARRIAETERRLAAGPGSTMDA